MVSLCVQANRRYHPPKSFACSPPNPTDHIDIVHFKKKKIKNNIKIKKKTNILRKKIKNNILRKKNKRQHFKKKNKKLTF